PAGPTDPAPTAPEMMALSRVVVEAPVPHCCACVSTLQAFEPLESSTRMPERAVGPTKERLQFPGERITAAPLEGVKPPNRGSELPEPQATSATTRKAPARFMRASVPDCATFRRSGDRQKLRSGSGREPAVRVRRARDHQARKPVTASEFEQQPRQWRPAPADGRTRWMRADGNLRLNAMPRGRKRFAVSAWNPGEDQTRAS